MASRTRTINPRTVNPRTKQRNAQMQSDVSPERKSDDDKSPPRQGQARNFQRNDGFAVMEPDAGKRERIAKAAAREEAQVRQHHSQRRQEIIHMMNQPGQTAHRLGGGEIDMEEVRRRQVQQAEAQIRRGIRFPATLSSPAAAEPEGNRLSQGRGTPEGLAAARRKIVEHAENSVRQPGKS